MMALPTVLGMAWVESFLKKEYFRLSKTLPIMEYMVSKNIYLLTLNANTLFYSYRPHHR